MAVLVEETNRYAQNYLAANLNLKPHARARSWNDINVQEMKAFVGLILNMGLVAKPVMSAYWDDVNSSNSTPYFSHVVTVNHFKLLLQFFHANDNVTALPRDNPNHDPLHILNLNFTTAYTLNQDISIDESLLDLKAVIRWQIASKLKNPSVGAQYVHSCRVGDRLYESNHVPLAKTESTSTQSQRSTL